MSEYTNALNSLKKDPKTWLITGVGGFIGSNLLEHLLKIDQKVIGLDNFITGKESNLDEVKSLITADQWSNFTFIEGSICELEICIKSCDGVDYVLHQAALGSVPRSIENPIATNDANITGFLNILIASRDANVKSFTYAASSSTYGDNLCLPKLEDNIGSPLSPYAITKYVNELYAEIFSKTYGFHSIGLRYFNVFGKRQDPDGSYAAVIPKWISSMIKNEKISINGDGSTSRDFCFIENVIQANILSAIAKEESKNHVYNVSFGGRTTLLELYNLLKLYIEKNGINVTKSPIFKEFRKGDVLHSQASIEKASIKLGYKPLFDVNQGIDSAIKWYLNNL